MMISPAPGGIGRAGGHSSQHDIITNLGEVRAIDIFPVGSGPDGNLTRDEMAELLELAVEIGFTGIGFYTDTHPRVMMHVDVRAGDHVATWSRIDGQYKSIKDVL